MNQRDNQIRTSDLVRLFFRSFLIQASWSFERMQSLGFAYAVLPLLRKLYPGHEEYRSRLQLHLEYFNTQPYLAAFILGATARIEEDRAAGRQSADVSGMKNTLMAPLGALGDSFFWGALRPLAAVIAVATLMTGVWAGPVIFLIIYNTVHLWLRAEVLAWGYRSAGDLVALMSRYSFTSMARLLKALSLSVLGGTIGMVSMWTPAFKPAVRASDVVVAFGALLTTFVLLAAVRKGRSPVQLMLGLAVACVALAYLGVS